MYRLHQGLRETGVDSHILCRTKTLDSPDVTQMSRLPKLEYRLGKITKPLGLNDIHLVSSFGIKRNQAFRAADVLDLQGIHTRTLSYLALPSLTRIKPAVFTMHDMWALTGHCAYSYDCQRWKTGCGKCPHPETHPAIPNTRLARNNTCIEWRLKKWAYHHSRIVFAAPSTWLVRMAQESMISGLPIVHIPYGLDTDVYRPLDRAACRAELGIDAPDSDASPSQHSGSPAKVLMFSALKLDNHRKGGDLLFQALKQLPAQLKKEIVLLTIGTGGETIGNEVGIRAIHLGYVDDKRLQVAAYNAADLFLCPTRADNLPLVLLESMACGTPMVAYAVGGVPDLVRPGVTGYLAKPEDAADFTRGIVQLLANQEPLERMRKQARQIALQEYRRELQVQRYIKLYTRVLSGQTVTDHHPADTHRPAGINRPRQTSA